MLPDLTCTLKNRLDLSRLVELDSQLREYAKVHGQGVPSCGWVKTIRRTLGMSSIALGGRVGMSAQGVRQLEVAEVDLSISLRTLSRLANGLNCDVHYVLVPRGSLVEQVMARANERMGGARPGHAPDSRAFLIEPESVTALSELLAHLNRRDFW